MTLRASLEMTRGVTWRTPCSSWRQSQEKISLSSAGWMKGQIQRRSAASVRPARRSSGTAWCFSQFLRPLNNAAKTTRSRTPSAKLTFSSAHESVVAQLTESSVRCFCNVNCNKPSFLHSSSSSAALAKRTPFTSTMRSPGRARRVGSSQSWFHSSSGPPAMAPMSSAASSQQVRSTPSRPPWGQSATTTNSSSPSPLQPSSRKSSQ
mmetsp:Transcript_99799/g.321764  ORF Transcript_99799/g.321764 Transcript_99799/m.321764 type:complete len:207 (-) Transcript_99799:67-687(-)